MNPRAIGLEEHKVVGSLFFCLLFCYPLWMGYLQPQTVNRHRQKELQEKPASPSQRISKRWHNNRYSCWTIFCLVQPNTHRIAVLPSLSSHAPAQRIQSGWVESLWFTPHMAGAGGTSSPLQGVHYRGPVRSWASTPTGINKTEAVWGGASWHSAFLSLVSAGPI